MRLTRIFVISILHLMKSCIVRIKLTKIRSSTHKSIVECSTAKTNQQEILESITLEEEQEWIPKKTVKPMLSFNHKTPSIYLQAFNSQEQLWWNLKKAVTAQINKWMTIVQWIMNFKLWILEINGLMCSRIQSNL